MQILCLVLLKAHVLPTFAANFQKPCTRKIVYNWNFLTPDTKKTGSWKIYKIGFDSLMGLAALLPGSLKAANAMRFGALFLLLRIRLQKQAFFASA